MADTENTNGMITVTIKQLDGHSFNLTCSEDATVLGLKTMIMEERNLTMDRQRLIYRAQELTDNERILSAYGVTNGSVLHIVIRPVGGAAPPAQPQVAVDMPQLCFVFIFFHFCFNPATKPKINHETDYDCHIDCHVRVLFDWRSWILFHL